MRALLEFLRLAVAIAYNIMIISINISGSSIAPQQFTNCALRSSQELELAVNHNSNDQI